jgi:hypothetical protein
LKNINADPIMSGKIKCLMKDGRNAIGKKDPTGGEVTVLLAGAGIVVNHSYIVYDSNTRQAIIYPNEEDNSKYKTTVNGEVLTEPRPLEHGDRVLFGSHHYFIYTDPLINSEEMIDWEEAMKEANKEQLAALNAGAAENEEVQKQLKEMEEKLAKEKEAKEKEIEEQKKKMEQEKQQMLEEIKKKQEEMAAVKNDEMMKKMQQEMEKARLEFEEKLREQEEELKR